MQKLYTTDFKKTVLSILEQHSGRDLDLMISGGSILPLLDTEAISSIDSSRWRIYYADERVGCNDLNYTASLPFLRRTEAKVFPIDSNAQPEDTAAGYARLCKKAHVALLGVGDDGHVASLFPESRMLNSTGNFVPVYDSPKPPPTRITATLGFLNDCVGELYFLIPPSAGRLKGVTEPHRSIRDRLHRKYTVYVDSRKQGQ